MALSDWEEIIIDETGEIFDWFSFNGIEIGIQKNWIDIDTDDLSFSVLSSNLLIKGINVYVGQYYDLQAVFLFLRFFDGGMNRFNYRFGIGCFVYNDCGDYIGITSEVLEHYRDWLAETVGPLPVEVNFDAMLTPQEKEDTYGF